MIMLKQKFIVSVCAVVYKDNGELLVTERSDKEAQGSGLLSYPGGKIEDIEIEDIEEVKHSIFEETVKRELMEECGVSVYDDSLDLANNHLFKRFDGTYSIMVVFIAKFKSQKDIELDPLEIKDIHWMRFEDIDEDRMYDSVYNVYGLANKKIHKEIS